MTPAQHHQLTESAQLWDAHKAALLIYRDAQPLNWSPQKQFELNVAETLGAVCRTLLALDRILVASADQWGVNIRRVDVDKAGGTQ
jgi:hypothetical protein